METIEEAVSNECLDNLIVDAIISTRNIKKASKLLLHM